MFRGNAAFAWYFIQLPRVLYTPFILCLSLDICYFYTVIAAINVLHRAVKAVTLLVARAQRLIWDPWDRHNIKLSQTGRIRLASGATLVQALYF